LRFLIDECLTVELTADAHARGFEAYHVVHVGKSGWSDWNIAAFAVAGELIVVTNNAADFLRLYGRRPVHPGLVIILPSVTVAAQRRLFSGVLEALRDSPELVSKVIEADFVDGEPTLMLYEFPAP
jgi:predicted nuclease of predicted toxin-antitoxin system